MSILNKIVTRVFYYPSLGYSAALQSTGVWRKWDRLDDHVLLGGVPSRADVRTLAGLGVSAIVNLCEEFKGHAREMEAAGISQIHLPTLDYHCPTPDALMKGVRFILDRRVRSEQTYVHCKVGRARSATLAMCYLIAAGDLAPGEAFHRLKVIRPQIVGGLDQRPAVIEIADALRRLGTGQTDRMGSFRRPEAE